MALQFLHCECSTGEDAVSAEIKMLLLQYFQRSCLCGLFSLRGKVVAVLCTELQKYSTVHVSTRITYFAFFWSYLLLLATGP